MEELEYSVVEAQRFFDARRLAVADVVCRGVLAKDAKDAGAVRLLARIARDLGEEETASRIMVQGGLGAEVPRPAGMALPDAWHGVFAPEEKFLVIKAWGNGMFSDVDHTMGLLLLAEMTGRTPVVHWGRNSMFSVDPEKDAWREFFGPVSRVGIDDLVGKGYDFWPPKWNEKNLRTENLNKLDGEWSRLSGLAMLNRPERVVVADYFTGVPNLMGWLRPSHPMHGRSMVEVHRYLLHKYAHVRPDILAGVGAFANERMPRGGDPTIAVHVRGSDKLREDPSLPQKMAAYAGVIDQFAQQHQRTRVFLMTDSAGVREEYAARYGDRLITTECVRTSTEMGSHFLPGQDRRRIGVEVLTDALLATTCDYFVGLGSSNVTCFIFHLKPWGQRCMMIGPLISHQMNPYLYMSHDQLDRYLPADTMGRLRARALHPPLG